MNVFPKKIMLLGSGELGKEVAIAAKRSLKENSPVNLS